MSTIAEIEQAVACLSKDQRRRLLDRLAGEMDQEMGVAEPAVAYGGAAEAREFLSLEDYFEMEAESSILHEYLAGEIFAMAEPSQAHDIIAMNLAGALHAHVRDRPCRVYATRRQLQLKCFGDEFVYRPDVWIACGEARNAEGHYVDEPCLVIEVLSPSTARIDKREKVFHYQEIRSISEYVLVAQKAAHVTIYRRAEQWKPEALDSLADVLDLRSVGLTLSVARIYKGIAVDMHP